MEKTDIPFKESRLRNSYSYFFLGYRYPDSVIAIESNNNFLIQAIAQEKLNKIHVSFRKIAKNILYHLIAIIDYLPRSFRKIHSLKR